MVFVDCVFLEYFGEKEFSFFDDQSKKYTLKTGDIVCLKDDSLAKGLAYKKTLFKPYVKEKRARVKKQIQEQEQTQEEILQKEEDVRD